MADRHDQNQDPRPHTIELQEYLLRPTSAASMCNSTAADEGHAEGGPLGIHAIHDRLHDATAQATGASLHPTTDEPGEHDTRETRTTQRHQQTPILSETTKTPLLDSVKTLAVPEDWPITPKPIRSSWWITIMNGTLDLSLLACAVAFLAFAAIVSQYNQTPTAKNPRTTSMLLDATKYVSQEGASDVSNG